MTTSLRTRNCAREALRNFPATPASGYKGLRSVDSAAPMSSDCASLVYRPDRTAESVTQLRPLHFGDGDREPVSRLGQVLPLNCLAGVLNRLLRGKRQRPRRGFTPVEELGV